MISCFEFIFNDEITKFSKLFGQSKYEVNVFPNECLTGAASEYTKTNMAINWKISIPTYLYSRK